ncbi:MAG: alpha/beta hydrolase [Actinomycetota bacterium]
MHILLVHGRAQGGKSETALRAEWLAAMRDGFTAAGLAFPDDVTVDLPFYGDALDRFVDGVDLPTTAEVASKGPGTNRPFEEFLQAVLTQLEAADPSLDEATIRAETPEHDIGAKGPQNWRWVNAIARVVNRRMSGLVDVTIEAFLTDVFLYVTNRTVQRSIDRIVSERLTAEPTIVIGHSLGSVVSYNVIAERQRTADVVKHITVGSPLGLKAIAGRLGVPANRAGQGWLNAFDQRDIVALVPLDAEHFPTTPPIVNDHSVDNGTDNRHGISGYLTHRTVVETIDQVIAARR